jgi:hypothetical protein
VNIKISEQFYLNIKGGTIKMKLIFKPSTVYEAVYPFYVTLKIFGLVLFSFDGPIDKGRFKVTVVQSFYFCCILFLHLCGLYQIFGSFSDSVSDDLKFDLILDFIVIVVVLGLQNGKQNEISKFIQILHSFDLKVCKILVKSI